MPASRRPRKEEADRGRTGPETLILDGGLATELEADGFDLNHPLWSAKVLIETPEAVRAVHARFLAAGADCIISATYQASFPGLARYGLPDKESERLFRFAVELAAEERNRFWRDPANREGRRRPLVAASVGPYGAFLADGSEYTGDYRADDAALAAFHWRRLELLARSGADLLAIETIPSACEGRVLRRLLERLEDPPPAWLSFTCRDGARLSDGTPVEETASDLAACARIRWIGVNCTAPKHLATLIPRFREATGKPVVAYPNGDGRWDPVRKVWETPAETADLPKLAPEWRRLGAALVGGCCRTRPRDIREIRAALENRT
ncbi:MAG: homocysteine S-methyltransferase [Acidobacteriota bacterium]|nr:homocysteine S-methyltransferase [Acidobacteriota bacterium]